ncbi:MAG: GNAT family N-acetyltransferase [Thermoplasmataceae archaeon]|jgi:GNAT superfamily N-acetyltransferase|nr:GNAT family N-acetyltransferase [Candidatus Thermoplasmatota archaeon]
MDIENVKINWKPLLEIQKKQFQDLYPDLDIENTFASVENQLAGNLIPSRIIINGSRVKGFAYLTGTDSTSGRTHGLLCFPEPDTFSEDTLDKLLSWIEQVASRNSREIMIGNIAGIDLPDNLMNSRGYEILRRRRLLLPELGKFSEEPEKIRNTAFRFAGIEELNSSKYVDAQLEAYKSTPEARFLLPESLEARIKMLREIMDGSYGDLIYDASRLILNEEDIAGAILVCRGRPRLDGTRIPIIIDFFVVPEFRGLGFGEYLIRSSLHSLQKSGFKKVELWVTEGNSAEKLYRKMGFSPSPNGDIAYLKSLR